ncbi:ABC transporter permease [Gracilibacillus salinarum]|uniref:Autoinducer 2 import system permease protein LsrD n=1 Tax=Gracilibacillus salinarum TaxID=2932255 RepID=A0ABY4GRH8_9BACI|nr:ABC transporter permease [Gracilibacillus salinarum]UOQ86996.1 ABC transporter permease [Gracilibacillus salinarum]
MITALRQKTNILSSLVSNQIFILVVLLFVLCAFFNTQSPYFLTQGNVFNISTQIVEIGLIAIPMTYVIISGNMDLSVGSIMGLSAVALGMFHNMAGLNIWLSVLLALLVGLLCGTFNAFLISKLKMQAIVVTIGSMVMLRGVIYVLTEGRPISGYPSEFYFLGQGQLLGVPFNTLILVGFFLLAYYIIRFTRFGRYTYGLGNNEDAVYYSGINQTNVRFTILTINGLFAGLAGVFLVSRLATAEATTGNGIELSVITAVLIGGTHIFGGRGSLGGTMIGVLIIGVLNNGLNLMGVSSLFQMVILGLFILIAVSRQKS